MPSPPRPSLYGIRATSVASHCPEGQGNSDGRDRRRAEWPRRKWKSRMVKGFLRQGDPSPQNSADKNQSFQSHQPLTRSSAMPHRHHHHGSSMEHLMGLLKINVRRGIDLAVRDIVSSDPYVVVKMGSQKVKTRVVKKNTNPEWNDELTLSITDPKTPIQVLVYDKDTFSLDDTMGDAYFSIEPFLEAQKMGLSSLPNGTIVTRVQPNRENCYSEESRVVWQNGKVVQDMVLRLRNVERGEVELQIHWVNIPGSRGLASYIRGGGAMAKETNGCMFSGSSRARSSSEALLGLLRIKIKRGYNLAVRDLYSSDPYVVVQMGKQKVKTRVVKRNLNPEWNENLTLCVNDPSLPIKLRVYDRDTFSFDDRMGEAEFDIRPLLSAVEMDLEGLPSGIIVRKLTPTRQNCLAEESYISWVNGRVVQDMILHLRNVERGEIELHLQWIDTSRTP
ncbi:hypothetical protein SAY86_022057 [Trapa natans]|uniref:C2 domain-containing protein n=1 Tax=Trapa natans TaxID=22666 RepID=A0AAN7M930_TRANT|nr:hypothetical protein SAY86_022057 [Trapa natans]